MPRERAGRESWPSARGTSVVVELPRRRTADRLDLTRLVPSGRALLLAFGLLAAGLACWWLAGRSSLFALRHVEVSGAQPAVADRVQRALRDEVGSSLLGFDVDRARRSLLELPSVRAVTLDRAFPNTLRVIVVPERPVGVLRQGSGLWLVSARGRVMGNLERGERPVLPRIWLPRTTRVARGGILAGDARMAVAAVAPLAAGRLPGRVRTARARPEELTLVLRSGVELRLGRPSGVRLKLRVLARVLPLVEEGTAYVDVSVPERPVAGQSLKSQVEIESQASTVT